MNTDKEGQTIPFCFRGEDKGQQHLFLRRHVITSLSDLSAILRDHGLVVPVAVAAIELGITREAVYKKIWFGHFTEFHLYGQLALSVAELELERARMNRRKLRSQPVNDRPAPEQIILDVNCQKAGNAGGAGDKKGKTA